ncbi:MAG TPA: DNA-processing protein DprA [Hyphomicrobiaceae bacterium]
MPGPDDKPRPKPPPLPTARLDDSQRLACLRLIRSENVGPATFRALINHFGGARAALEALPELSARGGRRTGIRICSQESAERELAAAERIGARPLFTIEPGYPAALAVIDGAPPLIYVKGDDRLLARPAVGIVGSRASSAAGQQLARQLAAGLGQAGYVVASGLAIGIDAAAHQASLETGTIAVLAGGIDVVYPPQNAALHHAIGETGCLVSEQPPGFQPRGKDFPRRNRIISGLSLGVVVVEAARRSGSLITARRAADQGREVFAVPGHPLDPRAAGTNQLIKEGATLVTCAEDVVNALEPFGRRPYPMEQARTFEESASAPNATPEPLPDIAHDERSLVVAALGPSPVHVDELARATGLPIRIVQTVLLELALAGRIEHHGSQLVSLIAGRD